jgi:hypothetical protein
LDHRETDRIAAAFRYMATALDSAASPHHYAQQLQAYFVAIVTIRSGGFLRNKALYDRFEVFGPLADGARLAVYNSGSFGQHVYRHLQSNPAWVVAGWYDQDHRENALLRMPVSDPDTLQHTAFDHLLLPSFDPALHAEVAALCQRLGVDRSKVRPVSIDTDRLEAFVAAIGYDPLSFRPLSESAPA